MTEASGDTGQRAGRRWDVALSFAGAQRDYVGQVAAVLKTRGVRCFYDADEQIELWGKSLAEELPQIYARESAAVVVFLSAEYAGRDWTRMERRAAFSQAVAEAGVYVLPAPGTARRSPGTARRVPGARPSRHTSPCRPLCTPSGRFPGSVSYLVAVTFAKRPAILPGAHHIESLRDVRTGMAASEI